MESIEVPTYEVVEDVRAEHVTITQGGAALVSANTVEVTQGGIQAAETKHLKISQGGAMVVETETADLTMSGTAVLNADTARLQASGAGIAITDTLQADSNSTIGFLLAGTIEGEPKVRVDARSAAAFGAALAVTLFILRRLFKRG